jgi:hypothetical protein
MFSLQKNHTWQQNIKLELIILTALYTAIKFFLSADTDGHQFSESGLTWSKWTFEDRLAKSKYMKEYNHGRQFALQPNRYVAEAVTDDHKAFYIYKLRKNTHCAGENKSCGDFYNPFVTVSPLF